MNGTTANLSALVTGLAAFGRRKISERLGQAASPPVEPADRAVVEQKMRATWTAMGMRPATQVYFMRDAFNVRGYVDVVGSARERWGSLKGKRVLDLGCGWGGLSVLLAREGADLTFIDYTREHVEVAGLRAPSGKGYVADARDLAPALGNPLPKFDFVMSHAVIEHVGNPPDHRGDALPGLESKRKVFQQAAAVLEPGGRAFFSTGNYEFPFDGEIKAWFFHWLPKASQARVLDAMGIEADNYGLLSWPQFESLATSAGFEIESVSSGSVDNFITLLRAISALVAPVGLRLPPEEIEEIRQLMRDEPRFMPNWNVFLKKR